GVRARRDDERVLAVQCDDDLDADELLVLVRPPLDRRLAFAAAPEIDAEQVRRRSRAGMVVHSDDPAHEEVAHAMNTKRPAALRAPVRAVPRPRSPQRRARWP